MMRIGGCLCGVVCYCVMGEGCNVMFCYCCSCCLVVGLVGVVWVVFDLSWLEFV